MPSYEVYSVLKDIDALIRNFKLLDVAYAVEPRLEEGYRHLAAPVIIWSDGLTDRIMALLADADVTGYSFVPVDRCCIAAIPSEPISVSEDDDDED